MVKLKVHKGDTVLVRLGRDRGKQGKVMRVFPREGRILVEGINMVLRHRRPRRAGEKGQRVQVASALPISSVMVVCNTCKRGVKVGRKLIDGKLTRVCRKCQSPLS
jgi:large subunit ribosomal protein L24